MSIFLSYFDLFADQAASFDADMAVQDWGQPLDHSAPLSEADTPFDAPIPESFYNDPDPDYGFSYRNDTVGVGSVMDTQASHWQDMVWIDWD